MQIIQSIREKGAYLIIVVIALCLIAFILMDSKQSNSSLFGCSESTEIGSVNGEKIDRNDFYKLENDFSENFERSNKQKPTGPDMYYIKNNVWQYLVQKHIILNESSKLGINITDKEISYVLYNVDDKNINPLAQYDNLRDSITNKLDPQKIKQELSGLKKLPKEEREKYYNQLFTPLPFIYSYSKYESLLKGSISYPNWMKEQDQKEDNEFSNISLVTVSYNEISDSAVKVTDQDVQDYVSKNKELFKQEAGRTISYVSFDKKASKDDSTRTFNELNSIKAAFETDTTPKSFVAKNLSTIEFGDSYTPKSKLPPSISDTITKVQVNTVYGPFVESGNYVLAKLIGTKMVPDSAKAKHILIALTDRQTGNQLYSDADGKKLADSLLAEINKGANFDSLAMKYSADESNKMKGGDLGTFPYGTMIKEFNDFCFEKTPGTKAVVKTDFGYHIIDLISQTAPQPSYKIAYVNREIAPSDETINKAMQDATMAAASKDKKELEALIAKNGLSLNNITVPFKENDYQIGALRDARELVKWAFGAKAGDISDRTFNVGEQIVVAVLDKVYEKGTQDVATARPGCEAIIRNKKKAEIISKKIGANPTLESAATAYGKSILTVGADSTLTFSSTIVNGVGMEQKLIGAAFNKNYQTKVSPLFEGTTGVFIMKINAIGQKLPAIGFDQQADAERKISTMRNNIGRWYDSLNKQADIVDRRSKFF